MKKEVCDKEYDELISNIRKIHYSTNECQYDLNISKFRENFYNNYIVLNYMNDQWINSSFNKWQIFRNCPGMANTNSIIESFNSCIKRDFTLNNHLNICLTSRSLMKYCEYNRVFVHTRL